MNQITLKSSFFSFLSYDEKNVQDKIHKTFKDHKTHFIKNEDGSHFFGLIIDNINKIAYLVNRGTDGDNNLGNLHSWLYDANLFTGSDGMHNGFQKLANKVFDQFKDILVNYKTIVCCGHSQGSGVAQILAKLCCENLSKDKKIKLIVFAAPPSGNYTFKEIVQKFIDNGQLEVERYIMPGDPIASKKLRNKKSILLNGEDVGPDSWLPDIIQTKLGPFEAINHSCKVYVVGLILELLKSDIETLEDLNFLGCLFRNCVN
ncbi:MAG: hypothetical protein M0R17_02435 [Candidatus Omnitrophica bacterium]|jgi:hypothetical protein|nr:hypothetical protein [Candidatus Omnitrophota bacterium]